MEQHLHLLWNIFCRPIKIIIIGQTNSVKRAETTFRALSRNTKPKTTINSGTILWCGQEHLAPCGIA